MMMLILISSLAIWLAVSALHWQPVALRQERRGLPVDRLLADRHQRIRSRRLGRR